MKDYLGQEIKVGDIVVRNANGRGPQLTISKIIEIDETRTDKWGRSTCSIKIVTWSKGHKKFADKGGWTDNDRLVRVSDEFSKRYQ